MIIGAHQSAAGGIVKALDRLAAIGGTSLQIFASPPQSFAAPVHSAESISQFNTKKDQLGIGPVFIHAIYLLNLASPRPELVQRSVDSLTATLKFSAEIGACGVIYHTGSSLGAGFEAVRSQIARALIKILSQTPAESKLLIENCAGQGGTVGATPSEIGQMIKDVGSDRLATCLDTQHAFATGFDLTKAHEWQRLLGAWDQEIGLGRLDCLHVNDSKVECGSGRDRHENIGLGQIGEAGFKLMAREPSLAELPWILEVPGMDGSGPDAVNINKLRDLASI